MKILKILTIFLAFAGLVSAEQKLVVMRHGEASNNVDKVYNSNPKHPHYQPAHLTDAGKEAVKKAAKDLSNQGINDNNIAAILTSPLPRAIETAELLSMAGLVSAKKIQIDDRLIELNAGDLEGEPIYPFWKPAFVQEYNAEAQESLEKRVGDFYASIIKKYPTGNIIVITHDFPAENLIEQASGKKQKIAPGEFVVIPIKSR